MSDLVSELAGEFVAHVYSDDESEFPNLTDWFDEWMTERGGIEDVGGDHNVFLRVFILVLAMWHDDPDLFRRDRRYPITSVVANPLRDQTLPRCLEPEYWAYWKFRRQYGHQGDRPL